MEPQTVSPLRLVFLGASLLGLCVSWTFGCTRDMKDDAVQEEEDEGVKADAIARIAGPAGTGAHGFVRFIDEGDKGVRIVAEFAGLPPGEHGFHIHEVGECADDFTSAGSHFAGTPTDKHPHLGERHGLPTMDAHHAGDLGNVTADGRGTAHVDVTVDSLSLSGDRSIMNRSIIVHALPDQGSPDPSASGARIACGVIEKPAKDAVRSTGVERPVTDGEDSAQPRDHAIPPLTPPAPTVP